MKLNIKCLFGKHHWIAWQKVVYSDERFRCCRRCGAKQSKKG